MLLYNYHRTTTNNIMSKLEELFKPDNCMEVSLLIDHPKNKELNPPEDNEEEYQNLKKDIERQYIANRKKNLHYGNTDAITVYKNPQGKFYLLRAGHYRTRAHRELGIPFIKFEWSDEDYDPNQDDLTQFHNLEDSNSAAKRNESLPSRAVKKYIILNNAYYVRHKKYLTARDSEYKDFCAKRHIQLKDFKVYLNLDVFDKDNGTNLLEQLSKKEISLNQARQAMKEKMPQGKYDENRRNFYKDLKDNPQIMEFAIDQAKKHMKHYFDFSYNGRKVLLDKSIGTETNHITGMLSNAFNSAAVHAFQESGLPEFADCTTPQNQQKYFDIQFPSLCKPGFLDERIEVKAGAFGKDIADTLVYGGAGGFGVKPHEYFILIHDNNFKSMFIMMCTLDASDWKGNKKNTTLSLSTWWDKYKDSPEKYEFIMGSIRDSNKTPQIVFEDF